MKRRKRQTYYSHKEGSEPMINIIFLFLAFVMFTSTPAHVAAGVIFLVIGLTLKISWR